MLSERWWLLWGLLLMWWPLILLIRIMAGIREKNPLPHAIALMNITIFQAAACLELEAGNCWHLQLLFQSKQWGQGVVFFLQNCVLEEGLILSTHVVALVHPAGP